jgi:acetyl-CoA carboxylase biotin carboxyl carrier protein
VTYTIEPAPAGHLSEALEEVRRSAQRLLADVDSQPQRLRIRAGDVAVELEWTGHAGPPAGAVTDVPDGPATGPEAPPTTDGTVDVCAPTVGTFYRAPEPGATPFVSEGDHVRRGQQVGIVEAMKLMIPIEADQEGVVAAVHVADATPVEYGDRLLTLAPVAG